MQITASLVALFLAAAGVQALPGSPVQERQATPTVYARFYPDGGCHGDWVDDTVFAQSSTACVPNSLTAGYNSTFFSGNTATRTLRLFSLPGCSTAGNFFDLLPGQNGCFAQKISSSQFL